MQSNEKNVSRNPTRVLYIPKLPPLFANWNSLKKHFSLCGNVRSVVLNPQLRSCTVSFETIEAAILAKSKGCVWNNKEFHAEYINDNDLLLDPRAKSSDVFGYSELSSLWSDEDVEEFGVSNEQRSSSRKMLGTEREKINKPVKKFENVMLKGPYKRDSKLKPVPEPKSPKLKPISEKRGLKSRSSSDKKAKALMLLYTVKEKQKETKRKIKEALTKRKLAMNLDKNVRSDGETPSGTPVLSLKDKFARLEERDKIIRKTLVKSSNVNTAKAIIGTCPDMCPEKERIMREYRRLVSIFEMTPGTDRMNHQIAVKAYSRSSADQEEPLPHELRPGPVLSMTMSYLITRIMPLIENDDVNVSDWYDFCWDRLRGIRKDIIQQQLCSLEAVTIIEQCARFHICCYDRLWGADPAVFDEKINTENLMNCLQTLRHMYEDLAKENIKCPNEAEFNAYMILLNMKTGDLMSTYQLFSKSLQREDRIQTAVKLYLTFNNSMYSQFFKLVKNSTYLDACLLQCYFYHVRVQALKAIARAYCPPNKGGSLPLKQMKKMLKFDTAEDTELFCEGHGIMLKDSKRDFSLYRNDFFFPENKINLLISSSLVTDKRLPLDVAVVGDGHFRLRSFRNHKVHSSFTDDGQLHELATDASDQKSKSLVLLDDMAKTPVYADEEMGEPRNIFTFDESFSDKCEDCMDEDDDGEQFHEVGVMELSSMDVDDKDTELQQYDTSNQSEKGYLSTEEKAYENIDDKMTNDDTVSREQHNNSFAFKLDFPFPKIQKDSDQSKQPPIQSQFSFGLAANKIFGDKNQSPENSVNVSYSRQSSKDQMLFKNDQVFQGNENSLKPFEVVLGLQNRQTSDIKKTVDKTLPVGNKTGFTFNLKDHDIDLPNKFEKNVDKNSSVISVNDTFGNELKHSDLKLSTMEFNKENQSILQPSASTKIENKTNIQSSEFKVIFERVNTQTVKEIEVMCEEEKEALLELKRANEISKVREKEKQEMAKLRSDLRRRLKVISTRCFIRKWKEKIKKLKKSREEFPLLTGTHINDLESIWGTPINFNSISTHSLLNRLKEKHQTIDSVNLILNKGLCSVTQYLGNEIAENIATNNSVTLNVRDFLIPFYWKLIVSIPFLEDNFYVQKISSWLRKVFYSSDDISLGSVTKEISSQNFPVYYCVHVVVGSDIYDKDVLTSATSLLFLTITGVEHSIEKYERFDGLISNLNNKLSTVAVVNIGIETDRSNVDLIESLNELTHKLKWTEQYWRDFTSIQQIVKFSTSNVNLSNSIQVCTLKTLLDRIAEHVISFLESAEIVSSELSSAITDPNFVIDYYNLFFNNLEQLLTNTSLRDYDIVPPEFFNFVRYLNKSSKVSHSQLDFKKTDYLVVTKAFSKLKLPYLKPWPPHDDIDLLNILRSFCDSLRCSNILPQLVRIINLEDDIDILENLNGVSWISIIDKIVRKLFDLYKKNNEKCIVYYDENAILDLCQISFNFKLLLNY